MPSTGPVSRRPEYRLLPAFKSAMDPGLSHGASSVGREDGALCDMISDLDPLFFSQARIDDKSAAGGDRFG